MGEASTAGESISVQKEEEAAPTPLVAAELRDELAEQIAVTLAHRARVVVKTTDGRLCWVYGVTVERHTDADGSVTFWLDAQDV